MSINRFVGVGRLVADPELRYTSNGTAVTNFRVAINRPFTNQSGEKDADYISCVIWRKPAENLAQYMSKGSQIGVDGRLQSRTYEGNDGKTVFVTEVVADSVQFLESKNSQNNHSSNQFANNGQPLDIQDDDLPF